MLVVDDEPSIRLLCRVNLELDGHAVFEAATLDDARAVLRESDVDVMLLDVHVGPEDGRELLAELRAAESRVSVVLLSGTAELGSVERGGADRVIAKPFAPEELLATVRALGSPEVETQVD